MTELELINILASDLSLWDKGKAIMDLHRKDKPSALKVQPIKERKARGPNKTKVTDTPPANGFDHDHADGH